MWTGLMQRQCVNVEFGYAHSFSNYTTMCTVAEDCLHQYSLGNINPGSTFTCAKVDKNPFNGVASFDDFIHSLVTVFIIVRMEGWTDYYAFVRKTFKDDYYINEIIIFLYFHIFIFIGGYYLMNLFLAVVWSTFSAIERDKVKPKTLKGNLSVLILEMGFNEKDKELDKGLTEKAKIEKYREKDKNKDKSLSEEAKIEKYKEKFTFIEKAPDNIPITYKTLNDLHYMDSLTGKELYLLNKRIKLEAARAESDFEKETAKLRLENQAIDKKSIKMILDTGQLFRKADTFIAKNSSNFTGFDGQDTARGMNPDTITFLERKPKSIPIIFTCIEEALRTTKIEWEIKIKEDDRLQAFPHSNQYGTRKTLKLKNSKSLVNGLHSRKKSSFIMKKDFDLNESGITVILY